jgi:hypothetical protein
VPVKAIHGTDGIVVRKGTSQTAYQGKTLGAKTMTPATIGTACVAMLRAPFSAATTSTHATVAVSASTGSFTNERTSPGLKYSSAT